MLVEINLLTEKEKKDVSPKFILFIICLLLLVSVISLKFVQDRLQAEIDQLSQERAGITAEIASKQLVTEENVVSNVDQLVRAVDQLKATIIPSSELVDEVVRLLPEYGYFLTFDFNQPDMVFFQVRFDQLGSVAAYQYALTQSDYIENVKLNSVTTELIELPTNVDNEEDLTTKTVELPISVNEENLTTNPSPSTTIPEDFLPRYVANFELKVNRLAFIQKGGQ